MLWMWGCAGVRRFEATRVFGGVSLFGGCEVRFGGSCMWWCLGVRG